MHGKTVEFGMPQFNIGYVLVRESQEMWHSCDTVSFLRVSRVLTNIRIRHNGDESP
jgi:hypothetical protein